MTWMEMRVAFSSPNRNILKKPWSEMDRNSALLDLAQVYHENGFIFQRGNASCHRSRTVTIYFERMKESTINEVLSTCL
jgi:hypothetical protein